MKTLLTQLGVVAAGVQLATLTLTAQLTPPDRQPIIGARMPALSADGRQLAFVYRGDIWMASSDGGRATPLTSHVEMDTNPLFSPDGQWVAFASRRNGNWDIFAVPAEGGHARQLTWHSGADTPSAWSPDSKKLVFAGKRDTLNHALFTVDVETLRTERLCEDFAPLYYPNFSPDGKKIVYGRYGFPWTRPRYHGSAAAQIWVLDLETKQRRPLTQDDKQHLWTRFLPDGNHLLTVTYGEATPSASPLSGPIPRIEDSSKRTPNLWTFNLEGRGRQLTTFCVGAVRWPTVALKSGDVAFEYGADLWRLKKGGKEPEKISLLVAADEKQTTRRREKLTGGATEAEPSPDGKLFAFALRGDLWTIPIEKPKGVAGRNADLARRLTDWAGDDSDFVWSQDGKKLYFTSDRDGNTRLYEMEVESLAVTPLWQREEDVSGPHLSPDGKQLGFWVAGPIGGLYVRNLESGDTRRVIKLPGPQWKGVGGGDYAWAPDLKWIAYEHRGESRAVNIWIVPAEGGEPVNLTRLYANHGEPVWSPDGKYLIFHSNRDGEGIYLLPLTHEAVRVIDTDFKYEKPKGKVEVKFDWDDITRRIRKISSQPPQGNLTISPDGQILFLSEGDVWSASFDGKETKRLTTGGGKMQLRLAADGKTAYFMQGGDLHTMNVGSKSTEKVTFTADWQRDVRAERKAAFAEFWRSYHRGFYDGNFHGRDWEGIRKRYEPLLEAVETNEEFATLLNMMIGELEASHSEVSPAGGGPASPVTPHLGFTFDYQHPGPGIRIADVPSGAPGSFEKTLVKPGEFVLAINGQDVRLDESLYQQINDKQDREFEFLVSTNTDKAGARTVKYKVLTQEEWNDLNYRNRIERLRKHVEDKSHASVGYVHISGMMQNNQAQFEKEIYEYMVGKHAMVIDVRFNTGGNISDTLIDWLERKPHGYFRPRDAGPETAPFHAWDKKIIVLMNEHSYSNGEMFPCAMRAQGLAKLVGKTTPGYVIWTSEMRLVDGTGARMPMSGVYRLDGSPMENLGEKPDVEVGLSPEDWLAQRDPQLDKAIEMLTH